METQPNMANAERYVIKYLVPNDPQERAKTFTTAVPHAIQTRFMRANPKAQITRIVNARTLEELPLSEVDSSQ